MKRPIQQAQDLVREKASRGFHSVEVWDLNRLVYREQLPTARRAPDAIVLIHSNGCNLSRVRCVIGRFLGRLHWRRRRKRRRKKAARKPASKRELIDTGTNKLYVRRNERGTSFKEVVDVGRSLAQDRRREVQDRREARPRRSRRSEALKRAVHVRVPFL